MSENSPKPAEWLAAERAFSREFASFERVDAGKSSLNYRAETPDGTPYLVKFAKPYRIERIMARLGAISSPLVPALAFGGATGSHGKYAICAMEWFARGRNVPPHLLTPDMIRGILRGHKELLAAFKAVGAQPLSEMEGSGAAARECGIAQCPIHGDFHYQNFFLDGAELTACLDVESMRLGLPQEDLLRIFAHEIERTRFWRLSRFRAIYRNLATMVRLSGYPKAAWLAVAALHENYKTARRKQKSKKPLLAEIDAWLRKPYYRRMRRAIEEA